MRGDARLQGSKHAKMTRDLGLCGKWQGHQGSNPGPTVLETVALPTELYPYRGHRTKVSPHKDQEHLTRIQSFFTVAE